MYIYKKLYIIKSIINQKLHNHLYTFLLINNKFLPNEMALTLRCFQYLSSSFFPPTLNTPQPLCTISLSISYVPSHTLPSPQAQAQPPLLSPRLHSIPFLSSFFLKQKLNSNPFFIQVKILLLDR